MNEDRAEIPCELCEGRSVTVIADRSRSGAALRTVACRGCGLVWSDPRPHEVRRFYEESYRLAYKGTFEPKPKHVLRAGEVALARLQTIQPWLSGRMRVLDVGSGGGEFAYLLQSLGHDVRGVEPNRGYAGYAKAQYGLDVAVGFIDDVELDVGGYDLITIWHVLEHTEHPGAVLRKLQTALKPGGVLVVEVPNVEATCQAPSSTFHEAHLYNFNRSSLVGLAEKSGLVSIGTRTSSDGGNLVAFFRPLPVHHEPARDGWTLPGNHDRVAGVVAAHRQSARWLSARSIGRLGARLGRMGREWIQTRRSMTGKERLDALYANALDAGAPKAAVGRRPTWVYVVVAYVVAVALEWALLDVSLLGHAWSEWQATGVYLALQAVAVTGIVCVTRRPSTMKQYARFLAWAVPLFALPAYC